MSMLFVHFQNQQFEKWTVSRVSGIFFCRNFHKTNMDTTWVDNSPFFDKKLHKSSHLCNFFIK